MSRFKPNVMSEANQASSLLLNHIKDQQFYSTLSTITIQIAKESGVQKKLIQELESCFSKVKGSLNQPMLTLEKQNNQCDQNCIKNSSEYYDSFQKEISLKDQINFLSKMENQLIQSRQKQCYINALKKYGNQKQSQLLPLLSIEAPTKNNRFRSILNKKKNKKVCTTGNYLKLNTLDLLKNAYENENECYRLMRSFELLKTVFGHSMDDDRESNCPLYNILFDQSQNLIISGGQQGAIKIWSKQTGLLLSSLKGHQEYINKLQITRCNKYICSSAGDGIRFFLLKDMTTLGGWKTQSIIDIASIYDSKSGLNKFMFGDKKNLYVLDQLKMLACKQKSLSKDDFLIYRYSHKISKQSYILNIQVSQDQKCVLLGFQTGDIMLFHYKQLFSIDPIKAQTQPLSNFFNLPVRHHLRVHRDQIRELKWHKNNQYFVSGGKQGYCLLWQYKNQKVPNVLKQIQVSKLFNRRKKRAFGCNFICFNSTNTHFVAGFMELIDQDDQDRGNGDIIAYSLQQKQTIFQFSKDMPMKVASVRGMDAHPVYPNIVVICQGTGRILLLDFILKTVVNTFQLKGFHLLHPQFSLNPGDCRFSKDGKYFVVSTQFGSISLFGYDLKNFYQTCPSQQFFGTDFTAFTVNQNMHPIPIEGDLQFDMNRIQRGQIRNIRGDIYDKQFKDNFSQLWNSIQRIQSQNPINHKNQLLHKDVYDEQNRQYKQYLQKIKFNLGEASNFNHFYNKNLQEIQETKQSLLYDEREKQEKVFKKIMQQKMKKMRGEEVSQLPQLTHDIILQQIDATGKRGGRRLTKARQIYPNYKDDNFDYNSNNEEQYNIQEQNQDQDLQELDFNGSDSSEIPVTTRRNINRFSNRNPGSSRQNRQNRQSRYNIRVRPTRNYNYDQNEDESQIKERNLKRRSPAEDIEDMLKDNEFRNYENTNRRKKKRKTNRMRQEQEQDQDYQKFINDGKSQQSQFNVESSGVHQRRRQMTNGHSNHRRRGRPKKNQIHQIQDEQQISEQPLNRLRKKQNKAEESQEDDYEKDYKIEQERNGHKLRTRNQNSNDKDRNKKQKSRNLGECYRCGVNQAVVVCGYCECACCQSCKQMRGKDVEGDRFRCFICMYINSTGSAILDQKKITEEYFHLDHRSQQVYVPQIDDQVRFFFQGYQEFLSNNIKNLNTEVTNEIQDYLLMPHIYNQDYGQALFETPLCRVKAVKYFFPFNQSDALSNTYKRRNLSSQKKHIHMLLNLQLILKDQTKKKELKKTDFWIFFIPGPQNIQSTNQYILREQIYQFIEQKKVFQRLSQNQHVQIDGEQYQIIKIGPLQDCFPESIWKQIKVSRSEGKRLRNMSKQVEKYCNVWNIKSVVPNIQYQHSLGQQLNQKKILDKIKSVRQTQSEHVIYEDYIEFQIYPAYRQIVEVGICLTSIQERVKNDYYRSLNSFIFDLDHMVQNSVSFNGEDNHVTRIGIIIRKQILKVLNVEEQMLNKFGKVDSQGTSKRQKRNSKKKEIQEIIIQDDQPVPNSQNIRSLRNTRSHHAQKINSRSEKPSKNKKKRGSQSQFNMSESQFNGEYKFQEEEPVVEEKKAKKPQNQRRSNRIQRESRQKPINYASRIQTTSKSKKYDKIVEEYDKEEEVYRNIQNRRNKSRYIDSSYESFEKNTGANLGTRRSSRLHNV